MERKIVNILLAAAAIFFFLLALLLCSYGLRTGMVYSRTEGSPEETLEAFFNALAEERYTDAYEYLANCSSLGLEQELPDRSGQQLLEAVRNQISYVPKGPCQQQHWHAEQVIELSGLSTRKMSEDLKNCVQKNVRTAAKNRDPNDIYDEEYNYKESFIDEIYMASMQEILEQQDLYWESEELIVTLEYREETGWQIFADDALVQGLTGNLY